MWNSILIMLMPYALDAIKAYIASSKTDSDDEVLKVVQEGCTYLSKKSNNDVKRNDSIVMDSRTMNDYYEEEYF